MRDMRKKFSEQLLTLLKEKTLEQITVTELSASTHVSRQTFYYYFSDVYDVAEYIFVSESQKILETSAAADELGWSTGYHRFLTWLVDNRSFCDNAARYFKWENVGKIIRQVVEPIVMEIARKESRNLLVTQNQMDFVVNFYIMAVCSVTMDWMNHGMDTDPKQLADDVRTTTRHAIHNSLQNYDQLNRSGN